MYTLCHCQLTFGSLYPLLVFLSAHSATVVATVYIRHFSKLEASISRFLWYFGMIRNRIQHNHDLLFEKFPTFSLYVLETACSWSSNFSPLLDTNSQSSFELFYLGHSKVTWSIAMPTGLPWRRVSYEENQNSSHQISHFRSKF